MHLAMIKVWLMQEFNAADAKRLQEDETFQAIFDKIRNDQLQSFQSSKLDDEPTWRKARSVLEGLDLISSEIQSIIDSDRIKEIRKKKQNL